MRVHGTVFFLLLFIFKSGAQELSYREYNTTHGMAQNQIVAWMQDRDGYIWFGHKAGLSRFDGINFDTFYEKDGLPDIFISTITQCADGKIYVLTRKGFAMFDGEKFIPYPYKDDVLFAAWLGNSFLTTCLGDGWIYTHSSGEPILFKDGQYFPFDTLYPGVLSEKMIPHWFSKDKKSFLYRRDKELWIYKHEEHTQIFKDETISGWIESGWNNTIGYQRNEKVHLFNRDELTLDTVFEFSREKDGLINYIDEQENIYTIEYPSILSVINKSGEKRSHNFKAPYINSVFRDRENNIWVMGETGAMMLQSEAFRNYTKLHGAPDYVWCIAEDTDGGIWLGSFGQGLFYYDGNSFQRIEIKNHPGRFGKDIFYKGAIRDRKGRLWLPHNNGAVMVEKGEAIFQENINPATVLYTYQSPYSDDIYFAQVGQVSTLKSDGNVEIQQIRPGDKPGLILSLVADTLERIWVGGPYGISLIDNKETIHLPTAEIPHETGAVAMVADHRGNIWIGDRSGLYMYDYKTVSRVVDKNNFMDRYVSDLKVMDSTGLFVGMLGGMAWLDLETLYRNGDIDVDFFDHNNGFLGREVLQNGSFVASDGTIWVSCTDRIIQFDPAKRKNRNRSQPNLIIHKISVLNDNMELEPLVISDDPGKQLLLKHHQKHLRFDFAGITMVSPEKVRYKYKMIGVSNEWSEPTAERTVLFTFLPPGNYSFMVDVFNAEGVWSGKPSVVNFTIQKAWWQTATALIAGMLISLLLFAGAIYFFSFRIKQERLKKLSTQKHIAELRLEAVKAQIDPHFTFNILSSIGSFIYKNQKEEAYQLLTRFSKLIRNAFEYNEKPYSSLESEISFTEQYLAMQKQRFKDAFNYEITVKPDIPGNIRIPRLLIQTLVENAVKHGVLPAVSGKNVEVVVSKEDAKLIIVVQDNGIGRQQASMNGSGSTGKGLQISRQLFEILNQYNKDKIEFEIIDLFDEENTPAGTRVWISVPEHYDFDVLNCR